MTTGGAMRSTKARKRFCGGLELSVTVTVNLYSPVVVGIPARSPSSLSFIAPGRLPWEITYFIRGIPPCAWNWNLYSWRGDALGRTTGSSERLVGSGGCWADAI